ncbi:ester cyclase [Nonomuraea sediminis]|uniref:ester cyclase n=1 Tax=Nonomuraea sediminis TaxID=2835864 RepID=UPI001BDC666B|nr:ester cyclase [Nonomuraea sediminis]
MKDIVMRFYDEILNQNRLEVADEIVSPAFEGGRGSTGPQAIKETAQYLRSAVPDLSFDIEDVISDGDRAATRWTLRGTHQGDFFGFAPTGGPLEIRACVFFRFEDGRVSEVVPVIDVSSLFRAA